MQLLGNNIEHIWINAWLVWKSYVDVKLLISADKFKNGEKNDSMPRLAVEALMDVSAGVLEIVRRGKHVLVRSD